MTELNLYNTLTRQKEVFEPEYTDDVRMYVCGPTVYDFAHIGNARPVIVFDVLFRLLRFVYGEDKVTYVRNITDVDDKINARALRDFPDLPLNEAIRNVTEKTANQFHADVKSLGCLEPTHEPRATEHIDGMATMIQTLLDKGHAYVTRGEQGREVLFRVTSMGDYGQLSNRKLEDQQAGARVAVEAHKENPGDFVLWKESNENEPGWTGRFNGENIHGRPGWHIECSVMAKHHLGETFDIHGGGLDLIFPHHENEIAQSCCAHDSDKMASVWMHNGYLQVEGRKMSKSEGNFVTIHDLLHTEKFGGRKWPGEVLRLAMLMTHYREPIDFSVKRLEEAENILVKLERRCAQENIGDVAPIIEALADDLNSSEVVSLLNQLSGSQLATALELLGISFSEAEMAMDGTAIDAAIAQRLSYFADKNFTEADRIRDDLAAQGIQLKDSKDSQTGERITTWEVKR
ncbi:MAG: cysteine--tRNA ligase [Pseudomonadota bacterium]